MQAIHIADLESAINYWRDQHGARLPQDARSTQSGMALPPEVAALSEVYGLMVFHRQDWVQAEQVPAQALEAWLGWYASTPDTPCIAICSTSQGDAVCKGCGRTEDEVQDWLAFSPFEKRAVWRRITAQATALRFNRYAERAR